MGYVSNEDGVDADFIKSGRFEIAIAGQRHAARASLRPMVDPTGSRMKA
jgi:4-methylaminobutanoate oxidase (formaldehyde-forming)